MKSSVLTGILSGVLAVTVAGSGALYWFSDKDDKSKKVETVSEVKQYIDDTFEFAENAIKGKTDYAYKANLNIKVDDSAANMLGVKIKDIELTTETKSKGNKRSSDYAFKYDSNALASINMVSDDDNFYLRVPELNESYIKLGAQDIKSYLDDALNLNDLFSVKINGSDSEAESQIFNADIFESIKEIDFEGLADDLNNYVDLIDEKIPEGTKIDDVSGEIDGHKYSYTAKEYDIKGKDIQTIGKAVLEKAKNDSVLKDTAVKLGVEESEYTSCIDDSIKSLDDVEESKLNKDILKFKAYYDGEMLVGINTDIDGTKINMVLIDNEAVEAVDCSVSNSTLNIVMKGSAEKKDNKLNGVFNVAADVNGTNILKYTTTLTDVEANEDVFKGTIKYDYTINANGTQIPFAIEVNSNSEKDNLDISTKIQAGGVDYVTVTLTGEKTDVSDITIPSGKVYSLTNEADMKQYQSECDLDKFGSNIKAALGDELYDTISKALSNAGDDDYNLGDDYVYGDDELDFEDLDDSSESDSDLKIDAKLDSKKAA